MVYQSYAIWWVPRPSTALAQFGFEWTGWCADRGIVSAGTRHRPRGSLGRRGLHASLRSPFRLAPGRSCWALEDALADLAERTEEVRLPRLDLTVLDGRVALVPVQADRALVLLTAAAADVLRPFALPLPFAAGSGEGPRDTADAAPTAGRFHLPLSDRLDLGAAYETVEALGPRLAPVLARNHSIFDLALVGDPGGGRPWRILQRYELSGDAPRDVSVPLGMRSRGRSLLAPLSSAAGSRRALF